MAKKAKKEEKKEATARVAKITYSYSRKVNLRAVSSQYDNITEGFFVTVPISYNDPSEFESKCSILANKVKMITENEIGKSLSRLMEMTKDPKNEALLGNGQSLEQKKFLENNDLGEINDLVDDNIEQEAILKQIQEFDEVQIEPIE